MTTTSTGVTSEWTATPMRPTARWVAATADSGGVRMEMVWAVPAVTVPAVTASGAHTAA
jgi:hypothetical protein